MSNKRFFIGTLCSILVVLILFGGITAVVDPFFHYHAPLTEMEYPINNQRYQNNGILKNFDYNAIITGTSMTENFKASQMDDLFNTKTIKIPFSGSYLKETSDRVQTAFIYHDIDYVVRSLDFYALIADKDRVADYDYPTYLYDNNLVNDTNYLLNKTVFFTRTIPALQYNSQGGKTPTFDEAYNWSDNFEYGKAPVLERYTRPEKAKKAKILSDELKRSVQENIQQNVLQLAKDHPETDFYLFFPPYSILNWDAWHQQGEINRNIDVMELVSEMLLEYDNIHLFSFDNQFEMICNFGNYKDYGHYGAWINEYILQGMKQNSGRLTQSNYRRYFNQLRDFYLKYDYDAIFTQ